MILNQDALDARLLAAIEGDASEPRGLTRENLTDAILAYVRGVLKTELPLALGRLIDRKLIDYDRDCSPGRPFLYSGPNSPATIERRF